MFVPELLRHCERQMQPQSTGRTLNGCETGNSKMTKGYNLPSQEFHSHSLSLYLMARVSQETCHSYCRPGIFFVQRGAESIATCFLLSNSSWIGRAKFAFRHCIYIIPDLWPFWCSLLQAFPSISTGIYGYPIEDATHIALSAVREFLQTDRGDQVRQCQILLMIK